MRRLLYWIASRLPRLSVTALHQAAQEVRLLARERAGAED